jgi:hypothetical protein
MAAKRKGWEMTTELILRQIDPVELYTGDVLEIVLDEVEYKALEMAEGLTADTAAERKMLASIAYKVAQSKTYLDGLGKNLVAEWKEESKKVDAARKTARDRLDALRDKIKLPLEIWEAAWNAMTERRRQTLDDIKWLSRTVDGDGLPLNSVALAERLDKLNWTAIEPDKGEGSEEWVESATTALTAGIQTVSTALERQKQVEHQQAELARLRAQEEARRQKEEAERLEAARLERELRIAAEATAAAEKRAQEQIERMMAATELEKRRAVEATELEMTRRAERREAAEVARAADETHRAEVNAKAAAAIKRVIDISSKEAEEIVLAVADGRVAGMRMVY